VSSYSFLKPDPFTFVGGDLEPFISHWKSPSTPSIAELGQQGLSREKGLSPLANITLNVSELTPVSVNSYQSQIHDSDGE